MTRQEVIDQALKDITSDKEIIIKTLLELAYDFGFEQGLEKGFEEGVKRANRVAELTRTFGRGK